MLCTVNHYIRTIDFVFLCRVVAVLINNLLQRCGNLRASINVLYFLFMSHMSISLWCLSLCQICYVDNDIINNSSNNCNYSYNYSFSYDNCNWNSGPCSWDESCSSVYENFILVIAKSLFCWSVVYLCLWHHWKTMPECILYSGLSICEWLSEWVHESVYASREPGKPPYLKNRWREFHPILVTNVLGFIDVLHRFWGEKVKGQGHSSRRHNRQRQLVEFCLVFLQYFDSCGCEAYQNSSTIKPTF